MLICLVLAGKMGYTRSRSAVHHREKQPCTFTESIIDLTCVLGYQKDLKQAQQEHAICTQKDDVELLFHIAPMFTDGWSKFKFSP